MTIINNRTVYPNQLENKYQTKEIDSKKLSAIIDNDSQQDQVLDLSGTKENIRNEIAAQDISSIKAIKVEGKLVSISQEDLKSLIGELKTKCLDENNQLKGNFKFSVFEKTTGLTMTDTNLEVTDLKQIFSTDKELDKFSENLSNSKTLFKANAEWKDQGSTSIELHANKSNKLEKLINGGVDNKGNKQISISELKEKLEQSALKIESVEPSNPVIKQLRAEAEILGELSELSSLNSEFQQLMSQNGASVPDEKTMLQIAALRDKIDQKTKTLEDKFKKLAPDISNEKFKSVINETIKTSKKSVDLISGALELSASSAFMRTQDLMEKPKNFTSIMDQYSAYKNTFKEGQTERPRKGETNDPKGFMIMRNNHLRDDSAIGKKFDKLTTTILGNDFNNPEKGGFKDSAAVRNEIEKMFKNTGIKKENIDAVADKYVRLYELKAKGVDLKTLDQQVKNLNISLDNNVINKVMASDDELNDLNKYKLGSHKAFGAISEKKLDKVDINIDEEAAKLRKEIDGYQKNVKDRIAYDFNNMATDSKGLIDFLEKDLSYDSKANIFIGVNLSAEAGYYDYSVGASADAKIGLTVEKRHTLGNTYRSSIDFSASVGVEAKLGDFLTLSAKATLDASIGVGFKTAQEIRELSSMLSEFATEASKEKPDNEVLNRIGQRISNFIESRRDASVGASADAEVESKTFDWSYKGGSKSSIETVGDQTFVNTRSYEKGESISFKNSSGEKAEFDFIVTKSKSREVVSTLDHTTVKTGNTPSIERTKLSFETDFKNIDEILSGKVQLSDEVLTSMAEGMIKADPSLEFIGKDKLKEYLGEFFTNAKNSSGYNKIDNIFNGYREISEAYNEYKTMFEDTYGKVNKAVDTATGNEIHDHIGEMSKGQNPLTDEGKKNIKMIDGTKEGLGFIKDAFEAFSTGYKMNIVIELVDNKDSGQRELKMGIEGKASMDLKVKFAGAEKKQHGFKVEGKANVTAGLNLDVNANIRTYQLGSIGYRTE